MQSNSQCTALGAALQQRQRTLQLIYYSLTRGICSQRCSSYDYCGRA